MNNSCKLQRLSHQAEIKEVNGLIAKINIKVKLLFLSLLPLLLLNVSAFLKQRIVNYWCGKA